jgi:hypothetical protein
MFSQDVLFNLVGIEWLDSSSLLFAEIPAQSAKNSSNKVSFAFTPPISASSSWKSASSSFDTSHFMLSTYCKHSESSLKSSLARWLISAIPSPHHVVFKPEKAVVVHVCYSSAHSYIPDESYTSAANLLLTKLLSPESKEQESEDTKVVSQPSYFNSFEASSVSFPRSNLGEVSESKCRRTSALIIDSAPHTGDVVFPQSAFPASYSRSYDIAGEILYTRLRSILQVFIPFIDTIRPNKLYRPAFLASNVQSRFVYNHRDNELLETYFNLLLWLLRDISVPIEDVLIGRSSEPEKPAEFIEVVGGQDEEGIPSKPLVPLACAFYPYIPGLLEVLGLRY